MIIIQLFTVKYIYIYTITNFMFFYMSKIKKYLNIQNASLKVRIL